MPTVQRCVFVSFLVGCCRNTVVQHARHLGGQPALSVDINFHLNTHMKKKKKTPSEFINSLCPLKYPFLLWSSNKNDIAKQKLLTACLTKMDKPPPKLFVFHNAARKTAASPANCKQDESQLVLHLSTRWSHF